MRDDRKAPRRRAPIPCRIEEEAPIDVEWQSCEFRDTELYGGEHFPRRQIWPLSLSASQVFPILTVAPIAQSMYVTVISGVLSLWFVGQGGTPTPSGDQAHMEFTSGTGPFEILLPPGEHRMQVGAADNAACVASIVIMGREGFKG